MERVEKSQKIPFHFLKKIKPMIKPLALAANGFSEDPRGSRCVRMERVSKCGPPHCIRLKAKRGLRQRVVSFSYWESIWRTQVALVWIDLHFEKPLCNGERAGERHDWKLEHQVGEEGCGPDEKGEDQDGREKWMVSMIIYNTDHGKGFYVFKKNPTYQIKTILIVKGWKQCKYTTVSSKSEILPSHLKWSCPILVAMGTVDVILF